MYLWGLIGRCGPDGMDNVSTQWQMYMQPPEGMIDLWWPRLTPAGGGAGGENYHSVYQVMQYNALNSVIYSVR